MADPCRVPPKYVSAPDAFRYRKKFDFLCPICDCRRETFQDHANIAAVAIRACIFSRLQFFVLYDGRLFASQFAEAILIAIYFGTVCIDCVDHRATFAGEGIDQAVFADRTECIVWIAFDNSNGKMARRATVK
jgi:hypothetical protein